MEQGRIAPGAVVDHPLTPADPREWARLLPESATRGDDGALALGGVPVTALAERFGTPLHVVDETSLRRRIRRFVDGLRARRPNSEVLFASKSFPVVAMYRLAQEEGLAVDVAGGGELHLALAAGVDPARLYLHGNAKTDAELRMALDAGVGTIIVDNDDEIARLERLLTDRQRVLLRVIPGIDADTHASQATGGDASKFGLPLDQAAVALERMRRHPLFDVAGVHLHIGSQILATEPFAEAVRRIGDVGRFETYDVGGGLGVDHSFDDHAPDLDEYLDAVTAAARAALPDDAQLLIEPGRSIIARAGVTLYRVTSVKRTGRTFLAVDGGMADQLDVALTGQRYEALLANRLDEPVAEVVQVVGRQCESGDLLVDGAPMPRPSVDDLVVMPATGAYGYTFSNNYNGALRPAVVFVADRDAREVVRRETYDDLLRLHAPALPTTVERAPAPPARPDDAAPRVRPPR